MLWVINGNHFKHNFQVHSSWPENSDDYYWRHNYFHSQYGKVDKDTGEIISRPKKEFSFSWSWCRKSWSEVERYVFVDFGDENLFWVTSGMGTSYGTGRHVSKEKFLRKYGGDTTLLETLIEKTK
jgi:fatty acid desaturase